MRLIFALLGLLWLSFAASANDFYVANYGVDTGTSHATSCTQAAPCRSIGYADLNITGGLQPGDTVHVAPGNYNTYANDDWYCAYASLAVTGGCVLHSGTAAQPITFISDIRWSAKVACSTDGTSYANGQNGFVIGASYIIIDGFDYTCPGGNQQSGVTMQDISLTSTNTCASPIVVTVATNTPQNGDVVMYTASVPCASTGPSLNTKYYVTNVSGTTFNIAATVNGAALNGTGTANNPNLFKVIGYNTVRNNYFHDVDTLVLSTNAPSSASTTLNFTVGDSSKVYNNSLGGTTYVEDLTTPSAIPVNTTIASTGSGTVVISNSVTVASGDQIHFSACPGIGVVITSNFNQPNLGHHVIDSNIIRHAYGGGNVYPSDCEFSHGIYFGDPYDVVTNNVISGMVGYGIQGYSGGNCNMTVSNNTVFDNSLAAIVIQQTASSSHFDNCTGTNPSGAGFRLANNTITNNLFFNNSFGFVHGTSYPGSVSIAIIGDQMGSNAGNLVANNISAGNNFACAVPPCDINIQAPLASYNMFDVGQGYNIKTVLPNYVPDKNYAPAANYNVLNYMPAPGSIADRTGTAAGAPMYDQQHRLRVFQPSIGALDPSALNSKFLCSSLKC